MHETLRARLSGLPQLDAVTIVAADGTILNYSREWPVRYWNLADRSYFKAVAARRGDAPYLSDALVDRFTRQPTVYLVRRLNDAKGRFVGIVIGAVRLSYFRRFYESLHLARGQFIALRQADGRTITVFPAGPGDPVGGSTAALVPNGRYGVGGVYEVAGRGGGAPSRHLVAATVTFAPAIRVEIGRSEAEVLAGWRSEAFAVGIAVLLAASLTALALWAMLRRWHALELVASAAFDRARALMAQRDLEDALVQAQKMDAIGQLAGGIAHDFNNMLALISGCLQVLRRRIGVCEPAVERCLDNSEEGVRRATALTARLLGFARKEQVRRSAVDVDAVIGGLTDLLDRTLGGGVIVETSTGSGSARARGDESQLENAILNLCVNARDAMPGGGRLTISTERIDLVANDARAVDLAMGGYVRMSVADTGSGIPPDVASRIFEPFFTTKAAGRGTGLGLSQVFAFARDSGGGVKVESAVGEGTTFHIYLPVWREGDGDDQAATLDRSGAAAHALAH
jgi:signal transduction histidine kinase